MGRQVSLFLHATQSLRVSRGIALLFLGPRHYVWGGDQPHGPAAFTSGKVAVPIIQEYPLYRRLGGPQGRSGWAENLVPTGVRSRTVHPVVSRYTD